MSRCFLFCDPELVGMEGADHVGRDGFFRCTRCDYRTVNHVEYDSSTKEEARRVLKKKWKAGRVTERAILEDYR